MKIKIEFTKEELSKISKALEVASIHIEDEEESGYLHRLSRAIIYANIGSENEVLQIERLST